MFVVQILVICNVNIEHRNVYTILVLKYYAVVYCNGFFQMGGSNKIKSMSIPHRQLVLFHLKIDPPLLKNPLYLMLFCA